MNIKDFFSIGELWSYFFRKRDPNRPRNVNMTMMHAVNRLAMVVFIICALVIIVRLFLR